MPSTEQVTVNELLAENARLHAQLAEAEETLRAIREGEVDAVIVTGSKGDRVFALTEEDNLHRLAVETMNEALLATSPDGLLVFCNDRASTLFGRPKEDLLGHDLRELVAPSDIERFHALLQCARNTVSDARIQFIDSSGAQRPMHVWASLLDRPENPLLCLVATDLSRIEADGELIGRLQRQQQELRDSRVAALNIMQDAVVDRQKAVEAGVALLESEQRIQQALRVGRSFTFEWLPEKDLVRFSANGMAILGPIAADAATTTGRRYLRMVHPEDRPRFVQMVRTLTPATAIYTIEYRVIRDRSNVVVLEETGQATFDAQGQLVRLVGIATDITERKFSEVMLRHNEARFRALIENSADAVLLVNAKGRILYQSDNAVRIFGYSARDMHQRSGFDFVHPDERTTARRLFREVVGLPNAIRRAEFRIQHHDGSWRWADVTGKNLLNDPAVQGVVLNYHDVTVRKEAEAALAASRAELQLITDTISVAVSRCSRDLRILWINAECARWLGRTQEDIKGRLVPEIAGEAAFNVVKPYIERVLNGEEVEYEAQIDLRDLGKRWVHVRYSPTRDAEGRPDGWVGVAQDIGSRKEMEQALREAKLRLDHHIANSPLAILEFGSDFSITRWSGDAEHIFGWNQDEVVGKSFDGLPWVHADDAEAVNKVTNKMLANRKPRNMHGNRNYRKDGKVIHCEWYNSVIYDDDGKLISIFSQVLDITPRKRALDALRESEERFRQMADSAPVLIWTSGLDQGCTWFNKPWLAFTGHTMEHELGLGWFEGVHPEDRERCHQLFEQTFEARGEFKVDYRLRRHDGAWRWVTDFGCPIYRAGEFIGYLGSCVDITDHKDVEAAQRSLNVELETRVAERTQALQTANTSLRQSEEKFRTWAEESPNVILVIHGRHIVYANRMSEPLLGYAPEELCARGFRFESLLAPKSLNSLRATLKTPRSEREEEFPPVEVTLRTKRRTRIEAILATRPIGYGDGQARLCILTDITALKVAQRLSKVRQKRLHQLAAMLATAQDAEQRRIGEGLHDDVAQVIAACSVKLGVVRGERSAAVRNKVFDEIDDMLREADHKIHSLSFELGASTLHQGGMENALRELCDRMATRYGVQFTLTRRGTARPLVRGSATVLFKAARELLFNVVKHAGVKEASIALIWGRDETRIEVVDYGKGFRGVDPNRLSNSSKGLGLFAARERLRDMGGELRISSTRGGATRVIVRVSKTTKE